MQFYAELALLYDMMTSELKIYYYSLVAAAAAALSIGCSFVFRLVRSLAMKFRSWRPKSETSSLIPTAESVGVLGVVK